MPEVWEMTQADFVGRWPVSDAADAEEAAQMERDCCVSVMEAEDLWFRPSLRRVASIPGYMIAEVRGEGDVVLLSRDPACGTLDACGGYVGSILWIERGSRGRGLAAELVLAKADLNGGRLAPESYTSAGRAAHRSAHRLAVQRAMRGGLRVPRHVLDGYPEFAPARRRDAVDGSGAAAAG